MNEATTQTTGRFILSRHDVTQQNDSSLQPGFRVLPKYLPLTTLPIHQLGWYRPFTRVPMALPSLCGDRKPDEAAQEEGISKVLYNTALRSPILVHPPQPLIVCTTDYAGTYGFGLAFEEEINRPTKGTPWTYSKTLDKLFVKRTCIVPIRVRLQVFPPAWPAGFYVKVLIIYKQTDHYRQNVECCPNHIKEGHHAPNCKHLVKCQNPSTMYVTCPETGRHYLKIPLDALQAGCDFVTNMFQFMCFSSCPGSLNRRPILVIFTLEYNNTVLGRKVQNVRICASPGRDRTNEEIAEANKRQSRNATTAPAVDPHSQPVCTSTSDVTPPPTQIQMSAAPQTPPEETTTLAGTDEPGQPAQVLKLTKKRFQTVMSDDKEISSCPPGAQRLKRLKSSRTSWNSQNSADSQPDELDGTPVALNQNT